MQSTRTRLFGLALVIFASALCGHWPSVRGEFLEHLDDTTYLKEAVRLNGLTWNGVKWAFSTTQPYWHPLSRISHLLDYQIWGTNAAGHHAASVILHAFNAALLFGFLCSLLGSVASLTPRERLAVAFGVALVFAIHPLQVQSVAWISGRTQLLCMAFGIGTLWAYFSHAPIWVIWALFLAAVLSKPAAVSLPLAMLAMDFFPSQLHLRLGWGALIRQKIWLIAFGLATAAAAMITESRVGGLMMPLETVSSSQRVCLAVESLMFYPSKLAWPVGLLPYYPRSAYFSLLRPWTLASALCVVTVTALCLRFRYRTPALVAGWAAYLIFILPVSGLIPLGGQARADRYAYMAMPPLLMLAGGAVVWMWRCRARIVRVLLACLLLCELSIFIFLTSALTPMWRNDETVWRTVIAQYPNSDTANAILAEVLLTRGKIPEAIEYCQRRVNLMPDSDVAHFNLAVVLSQAGQFDEAIKEYDAALRINPDYMEAHGNLGTALAQLGRLPEAIENWQAALRIKPDSAEMHYDLGLALDQTGKTQDAIEHYKQALRLDPNMDDARKRLSQLEVSR